MVGNLPLYVRPHILAQSQAQLVGVLPVSRMPRFYEICKPLQHTVQADIHFSEYQTGLVCAEITLQLELALQCCRCLEEVQYKLDVQNRLFIVESEEDAQSISDDKDFIICENGELELAVLIEEELLLQLPQFPVHQDMAYCNSTVVEEIQISPGKSATKNPFTILKRLSN